MNGRKTKTNKRMKQVKGFNMRLLGFFGLIAGIVLFAATGSAMDYMEMAGINITDGAENIIGGMSFASVPLMVTIKGVSGITDGTLFDVTKGFDGFKQAKGINQASFEEMTAKDVANLYSEYIGLTVQAGIENATKSDVETKEAMEIMKKEMNHTMNELVKSNQDVLKTMASELTSMVEKAKVDKGSNAGTFQTRLKEAFDAKKEDFDAALTQNKSTVSMVVEKATQTYGDIADGEDFAQMRPGVTDAPVRRPRVRSLFSTIPIQTEFYKYVEQATVIRDAQNVAKCAAVVSTTKETLIVRDMHTKVVKDMIDFCRLFISDYPFMQSRINKLLNESVALQEDQQLLLGTGLGEETFSIDSYSSEFSAANPVCVLTAKIQDASMVDLILGMRTQIEILGEQEAFMPNCVLVNLCDWFLGVESRKDLNNNYLDSRVTVINGVPYIAGMMVIPLQNVVANSLYVMDATKAEVLDRMTFEVEIAFQNKDNWEKEIATIKGLTRINLWSPVNWQNAFMKCTDITTAVAAILKP